MTMRRVLAVILLVCALIMVAAFSMMLRLLGVQ